MTGGGYRGHAAERTTLAWNRTALALAAAGALLVRLGDIGSVPFAGWILGGADVLLAAWLWRHEERRRRAAVRRSEPGLLRLVTAGTVATAAAAVVLSLIG